MATRDRYGAARKKKKRNSLFAPLSFLLVCAALVFGMSVFFRVQTIEVQGAENYTVEEIIEASGVSTGDNLFFINSASASSRIISRLPRVESASVRPSMPNRIIITVVEGSALAYVDWEGQSWTLTGSCKLLGSGEGEELAGLIHVLNVTPEAPSAGEFMTVPAEDSLKLSYLQELLSAMDTLGMVQDVSDLDMENVANPTFRYLDRFTVRMGQNDNTDYKLRKLLSAVMTQLGQDVTGTIDMSIGEELHVILD